MADELTIGVIMARRFQLVEEMAIIAGRHKAELAPLDEELNLCELAIKDEMNKTGQTQVKTEAGMAFFTTKDSVKVGDWEQTLAFIQQNSAFYLLNQAVNKTTVKEFIEQHNAPPPGVEYTSYRDLAWHKGKG